MVRKKRITVRKKRVTPGEFLPSGHEDNPANQPRTMFWEMVRSLAPECAESLYTEVLPSFEAYRHRGGLLPETISELSIAHGGATPHADVLEYVVERLMDAQRVVIWPDDDHAGRGALDRLRRLFEARYGAEWVEDRVRRWRSAMDANSLAKQGRL